MAKKKRKKSSKASKKLISKKKIRRLFLRTCLLALGLGVGVLFRPQVIKDPNTRLQVENLRDRVLQANDEAQMQALEALEDSGEKVKGVAEKAADITEEVTNTDPQEYVEEKVDELTEEIKSIPEEQVKKIKLEFCQDVIEEIEVSCE